MNQSASIESGLTDPCHTRQDRHRRRRHGVRARPVRDGARSSAGHTALIAVKSAAELLARVRADLAADRPDRARSAAAARRRASSWCAPSARSTRAACRFSSSAARSRSADEVRELAALGVAGYVNEYSAVQHILPSLAPHLFPDNFNRRGSPRVVLGIPIAYRFGNTIAAALTLNLEQGRRRDPDDEPARRAARRCALRFRLPGSKRDIEAEAPRRAGATGASAWACSSNGRTGRSGRDRRVRRRAFLHQPQGLTCRAEADGA